MISINRLLHTFTILNRVYYKVFCRKRFIVKKGTSWKRHFSVVVAPSGKLLIGENCFFSNDCSINCLKNVEIGKNSKFGEKVRIYDHDQSLNIMDKTFNKQVHVAAPVLIGEQCWIGSNVTILKGTNIGNQCVIDAGCVISGHIEDGKLVRNSTEKFVPDIKSFSGEYRLSDLVSIVVPVYKVEEVFLRRSIESMLSQTYQYLEIILIDDGSPDNSGMICDEYAKSDLRIKVLHIPNGGVSRARNVGLENASGNYIMFVDSDDYIDRFCVEVLLNNLIKEKADCSICAVSYIDEINIKSYQQNAKKQCKVLNQEQAMDALFYLEQVYSGYEMGAVWGCIYKKEIVDKILFNEKMKIGEDFVYKYQAFLNVSKVVCTNQKLYAYLIRTKSAMRSGFDLQKLFTIEELNALIENTYKIKYLNGIMSRAVNIAIVILFMIPIEKQYFSTREKVKKFIKKYRKKVMANPKSRMKVRIALISSYFGLDNTQRLFKLIQ